MLKIKLSMPGLKKIDISQFISSNNNDFKNYKFFINSDEKEVDFWFIFENLAEKGELSFVDPKNIFFLTAEASLPYDWYNKEYYDLFFSQFYEIYTCYPIFRDNVKLSTPFLPWMINSNHDTIFQSHKRNIDFFRNSLVTKSKKISVICSKQQWQIGHKLRYNYVKKLKEHFADSLDWYGNGINQISEKWDAIAPYKYHIVLENRSDYNFITEKIYDSYLGGAFPIYWGAPNLHQFFPSKSFIGINILDFKGSVRIIEDILKSNLYESRQAELKTAKELVLDKYNLLNRILNIIQTKKNLVGSKKKVNLKPVNFFYKKKRLSSLLLSPKYQLNVFGKMLRKLSDWIIKFTNKR